MLKIRFKRSNYDILVNDMNINEYMVSLKLIQFTFTCPYLFITLLVTS